MDAPLREMWLVVGAIGGVALVALALVSLVVAILQSAMQLQDSVTPVVVKLVVAALLLLVGGGEALDMLVTLLRDLWGTLPLWGGPQWGGYGR